MVAKEKTIFEDLCNLKERFVLSKENILFKRNKVLERLQYLTIEQLVERFSFKSMQQEFKDFCPMLEKGQVCHNMSLDSLNCYGCACPKFNVEIDIDTQTGLYKLGMCQVNSRDGYYKKIYIKDEKTKPFLILILDCSNCNIPHDKSFIANVILKDLEKVVI